MNMEHLHGMQNEDKTSKGRGKGRRKPEAGTTTVIVVHAAECGVALSEKHQDQYAKGNKQNQTANQAARTKTTRETKNATNPKTKQKEPEEHKPTQGKQQAVSETLHTVARGSVHYLHTGARAGALSTCLFIKPVFWSFYNVAVNGEKSDKNGGREESREGGGSATTGEEMGSPHRNENAQNTTQTKTSPLHSQTCK